MTNQPIDPTQRIFRAQTEDEVLYFRTRVTTAQDDNLSWAARGVLWYLLSKPVDWEVRIKDLQQQCGRDKAYSILAELRRQGYMRYVEVRDAGGKVTETFYMVYEVPQPLPEKPDTANTEHTYKREEQIREKELSTAIAVDNQPDPPAVVKPLSAYQLFVAAYCDLLKLQLCDGNRHKITSNAARLWTKGHGYTVADLDAFALWWASDDNAWRNAQPPGIQQINERLHFVVNVWAATQATKAAVAYSVAEAFEALEGNR